MPIRRLAFMIAVLCLSAPVSAQSPFPIDGFVYVLDAETGAPGMYGSVALEPLEPLTIHLCIANPSLGGVSYWEANPTMDGFFLVTSRSVTAGMDSVDLDHIGFMVSIGTGPQALLPNASGLVHVASMTGYIILPGDVVTFGIGSVWFGEPPMPRYEGPDGIASADLVGDPGQGCPWFVINDTCEVAAPAASWGSVKSLYR